MSAGLRILIVAEHASIQFGGEAALPYHYFRVLRARGEDAWLIVHERTRHELAETFPGELDRIRFVPDMALQKLFHRASKLLPRRIAEATFGLANQMLTQHAQRGMVRALLTPHTVVHQPIPVSPRFPSLLYGLGAPVVIGPMNGGMVYPPAFRGSEGWLVRATIALGRMLSGVVNTMLPGKRDAQMLLVANERTRHALPVQPVTRVVQMVENGVDLCVWRGAAGLVVPGRFVFLGRLVDWKALDVVLSALVLVPEATLQVIGDGPMMQPWQRLAVRLGVADRVDFVGWRTQAESAVHLACCIALLLPSVYECGGAVVLEAMAAGRPVIATAWGGPQDYLDAECGILIEPISALQMTADFASAMRRLMESPEECVAMGRAGRERIEREFDWEKKVDAILLVYAEARASFR